MLSRLCRSISRAIRQESEYQGTIDNQARNLNTVQDENNYTLERITRVIRSYFFIAIETKKRGDFKIWGKEQVIQDSVRKLTPLIKNLDPETLHLLIINLGMMTVLNQSVWKEIEENFLQNSNEHLPTSQLVSVVEAFSAAGRKNYEIWTILSNKVLNEIYSSGNLERKEFIKVFCGFAKSGVEIPELMPHLLENFRATVDEATPSDSFNLLEALSRSNIRHMDVLKKVIDRCLDLVSVSENKNYYRVLSCLVRIGHHQYIDQVEELFRANISNIHISSLSSLTISYSKPEFLENEKRKEFVRFLFTYYNQNKDSLTKGLKHDEIKLIYDMKFLITAAKYGIEVDDQRILENYQGMSALNLKENVANRNLKIAAEEYLKSKNLI